MKMYAKECSTNKPSIVSVVLEIAQDFEKILSKFIIFFAKSLDSALS